MFINPSMIRKPAETDVPMIPPILLNAPNFELIADAVAATTTEVMMTILMEKKMRSGAVSLSQKDVATCDKGKRRTLNDQERRRSQQ